MYRQKHKTDTAIAQAMLHVEKGKLSRSAEYPIFWHESQIYI